MKDNIYATKDSRELKYIEQFARLLDSKFTIPGTKYRFGLDPILGLIPFVGDATTFAIQGGLVVAMARHGASNKVITLMIINVVLDTVIGSIPVIGWIFDFFYKANTRNIKLLREHYEEGKHTGNAKGVIITTLIVLLVIFALLIWGLWELTEWLYNLIF